MVASDGESRGVGLLASDIPALLGITRELWALDDDQIAEIRPGTLKVTTTEGEAVEPVSLHVEWDLEAAAEGGLRGFHEQGDARAAACGRRYVAREADSRTGASS